MNELDLLQIIVEELAEMKSQPPIANLSEEDRAAQSQISKALTGIYEQIKTQPKNSELLMQLNEMQKRNADLLQVNQKQATELLNLKTWSQNESLKNQESDLKTQDQNAEDKFRLVTRAADKFASGQKVISYIIGAVGSIALIGSLLLVYTIRDDLDIKARTEVEMSDMERIFPNRDAMRWTWEFQRYLQANYPKIYLKYRGTHPVPQIK